MCVWVVFDGAGVCDREGGRAVGRQLERAEFMQMFNWWSSIDPEISAESKANLFASLSTGPDPISYVQFQEAYGEEAS